MASDPSTATRGARPKPELVETDEIGIPEGTLACAISGDVFCPVCKFWSRGMAAFRDHLNGKKHKRNVNEITASRISAGQP